MSVLGNTSGGCGGHVAASSSRASDAALGLVPLGLLIALLARVAWHAPVNHWGVDARWLWGVSVVAGGVSAWRFSRVPGWRRAWSIVAALLLALLVWALDYFNVLVEYERWLARGMPPMWQH